MTEYWICSKEWRIWSYIPYSPSDTDEFQWQLTNLNAEFLKLIDKTRMWMTIWRNWTLDLNAVSFSGRKWIENWWNWMQRWRKWAEKPILYFQHIIDIKGKPVYLSLQWYPICYGFVTLKCKAQWIKKRIKNEILQIHQYFPAANLLFNLFIFHPLWTIIRYTIVFKI